MKIELDNELIKRLKYIVKKCDIEEPFSLTKDGFTEHINMMFEQYIENEFAFDIQMMEEKQNEN